MDAICLMKNCAFVSAFLWIEFHSSAAPPAANVVQRHRGWTPKMLHLSPMIRRTFSIWVPGKHLCRLCLPLTSKRAHRTKQHCWAGLATPSITSGAQARSSPAGTAALRPWLPLLFSHHSSRYRASSHIVHSSSWPFRSDIFREMIVCTLHSLVAYNFSLYQCN
jgi:hypothetical protein